MHHQSRTQNNLTLAAQRLSAASFLTFAVSQRNYRFWDPKH